MVTLPQNLILSPGTVAEDFESSADWTPTSSPAGGTLGNNVTNFKTGTQSLQFNTPNAAGYIQATKTINLTLDGNLQFWMYAHDATPPSDGVIMLSNNSGFTAYYQLWYSTSTAATFRLRNCPGWNLINIRASDWTVGAGAPSWASPMVRLRIRFNTAAAAHSYSVDSMYVNRQVQPAMVITFDDNVSSMYVPGYQYLRSRRARASTYVISSLVGAANYLTWAQLRELYAAGWTVGNHTDTTTDLTTLTEAQQETALANCNTALLANSILTRQNHVSYPGGANNADTVTAMNAQGMISGRTILGRWEQTIVNDWLHLPGRACEGQTLAAVQGWIDTAKSRQEVLITYNHGLSATPVAGEWAISSFQGMVDYAIAQGVPLITMHDLYLLQSGPIRIPRAR